MSAVSYPSEIFILNDSTQKNMMVIIEASTHTLDMIDVRMKKFLFEHYDKSKKPNHIRCIRVICVNPRYWSLGGANPIIRMSKCVVDSKRYLTGLSQDPQL